MVPVTTEQHEADRTAVPLEPLVYSFELACSAEHAFRTWTERISTWWPASHTVSGEPDATVVLEPELGGRLLERTASGDEHVWGEITEWEPPERLGYLWFIRRDRADATDVVVTFTPLAEARTQVEILHTAWERLGDGETWRERNIGGWTGVLPHFIELAERND
jgi:uncharacterized protein YndB with AHSA1/START domain